MFKAIFEEKIELTDEVSLVHFKNVNTNIVYEAIDKNRTYLTEYMPWVEDTQSVSDVNNFFELTIKSIEEESLPNYAIFSFDKFVGIIGINRKDSANKSANLGYWLIEEMQGKGIMGKCVNQIIKIVFERTDINRIELLANTKNIRSQNVAVRNGFTKEGIKREAEFLNGVFVNLFTYSILKKEWKDGNSN